MIKNPKVIIFPALGVIGVFAAWAYLRITYAPTTKTVVGSDGSVCQTEITRETMPDSSMEGLLEKGETFQLIKGWYACNPVKLGDLVYYSNSPKSKPIPRVVKAIPGSRYKLSKGKSGQDWNITIDGLTLNSKSSEPYTFGGDNAGVLQLYEKEVQKDGLKDGLYLVFSTAPRSEFDSTTQGPANLAELLGKVEKIEPKTN